MGNDGKKFGNGNVNRHDWKCRKKGRQFELSQRGVMVGKRSNLKNAARETAVSENAARETAASEYVVSKTAGSENSAM